MISEGNVSEVVVSFIGLFSTFLDCFVASIVLKFPFKKNENMNILFLILFKYSLSF